VSCNALDVDAGTEISNGPVDRFLARDLEVHIPGLRRLGRRITGCDGLASDAVQEAVLRLWQRRREPPRDFIAWLAHTVVHRSLHLRRTQDRRAAHEQRAALSRDSATETVDPSDAAFAAELDAMVRAAMASLPSDLRAVLDLRCALGLDYMGIAARLGLPIGTVRSRLNRARRLLVGVLGAPGRELGCPICAGGRAPARAARSS
jgi:RNA polymerase sigma-70 factor (ECF subfamily)